MNQLAKKTATGAIINISVTLTKNVGQYVIVIPILARILTPEQFGLVAMAMMLVGFLATLNDLGISAALVRAENPSSAFWSSAFWLNLSFGLAMTISAYVAAPWVAAFFGEPQVEELARLMSCILMLHCSFLVPMAWLQRNFRFQTIAVIDLASIIVSSAAAIALALYGYGVWALAWQQIILYAVKSIAGLLLHRAPIRAVFVWSTIREVLPFSLGLTGTAFVRFLDRNSDSLLIGRFFGTDALGYYSRAYLFMMMPIKTLTSSLNFALYPAFSAVKNDTKQLGTAYLKVFSILSVLIFPMMTGLALVAVPFVDLMFGSQWDPVAPVLRILAFVGVIQAAVSSAHVVWTSRGRTGVLLRWSLIRTVVFFGAFCFGVAMGSLEAMAALYLIANIVLFIPFQLEVLKELDLSTTAFLSAIKPPLLSTILMALTILAFVQTFPEVQTWNSWAQTFGLAAIGAGVYFGCLLILFRSFVDTLIQDARALRGDGALPTTS